jgi:hypothetical protein
VCTIKYQNTLRGVGLFLHGILEPLGAYLFRKKAIPTKVNILDIYIPSTPSIG